MFAKVCEEKVRHKILTVFNAFAQHISLCYRIPTSKMTSKSRATICRDPYSLFMELVWNLMDTTFALFLGFEFQIQISSYTQTGIILWHNSQVFENANDAQSFHEKSGAQKTMDSYFDPGHRTPYNKSKQTWRHIFLNIKRIFHKCWRKYAIMKTWTFHKALGFPWLWATWHSLTQNWNSAQYSFSP